MIDSHIQKVIFVDEDFLDELKQNSVTDFREFGKSELDTQVIQLPLPSNTLGELTKFVHVSEVRAGAVLVKPDYSDRFISIDSFTEGHAERKYRLWVLFCMALGAKKVSVKNIEEVNIDSDEENSLSGQLSGRIYTVGKAEAAVKMDGRKTYDEARSSIMSLHAEASGGAPDLEKAMQILRDNGLERDDMFKRMYEMRSFTSNSLLRHEFSLDTSSDFKRVLDDSLKAKVELMGKIYKGKAEFAKMRKSLERASTALKLTVLVDF